MSNLLVINYIIRQNIYFGEYIILIKQKMASLKIKYRHSSIEGKAGTLFYQVIHNRVARQINSGYKIYPDEWDIFNSQIIIPAKTGENRHRYLVSLKKCIKEDTSRLKDIMIRFENLGYKVTTKKRNAERYSDRIELQGFQPCFRLFVKPSQSPLKPNQDAATLLVRNHARNGDKRTRITKQGVKD